MLKISFFRNLNFFFSLQNDSSGNGQSVSPGSNSGNYQTVLSNGYHNGHKVNAHNICSEKPVNGSDEDFYINGDYKGYESCEFQPNASQSQTEQCHVCASGKNGIVNGCVCKKFNKLLSYHQSLPRKVMNTKISVANCENGYQKVNGTPPAFLTAQQEIADMIENLDLTCRARLQECAECLARIPPDTSKLEKVRETLIYESRQFVTASKLFVKSITESSDKMEENLTTCLALLDRIFAVSELVVTEMTIPSQINALVEKLKEMAVAYSKTVQAAQSAAAGEIPNSNMASLMHQATSLATSLTVLMRTLRTFSGP